tara:strand:- start:66 stop:479 length:414 start_codon:yes stop_codon:yes gene_type:complete
MKLLIENWRKKLEEEYETTGAETRPGKVSPSSGEEETAHTAPSDLGSDVSACEAEQTDVVVAGLKEILEKWEESEYESDEARWQEYAKDVQGFIDEYGASDDSDEGTKEKKKAPKSKSEKAPSSPKSKAPKLAKMTY